MGGSTPDHYTKWQIVHGYAGGRKMPGTDGSETNNGRLSNRAGFCYLNTSTNTPYSSTSGGIVFYQDHRFCYPGAAGSAVGYDSVDNFVQRINYHQSDSWAQTNGYITVETSGGTTWYRYDYTQLKADHITPYKSNNNAWWKYGSNDYDWQYWATCSGGGWGARGGNAYRLLIANPTSQGYSSGTRFSYVQSGGQGGKAVQTNGHSVTFVGGLNTSRTMGAVG
jgi:hypothetical protein